MEKDGQPIWLIVGLGNPGAEYERTRHNVGFVVVDAIAEQAGVAGWRRKFSAHMASAVVGGMRAWLQKPTTYMNASGQAVHDAADYHNVVAANVVVIHDDVDLEIGRLKLKFGGGDGGHKGVASVTRSLGTPTFARVRLGIGKKPGYETADYVLASFSRAEQKLIQTTVEEGRDAVCAILRDGIAAAMNRYNVRSTSPE